MSRISCLTTSAVHVLIIISWTYCRCSFCCLVWLCAALGSSEDEFPYRFPERFAVEQRFKSQNSVGSPQCDPGCSLIPHRCGPRSQMYFVVTLHLNSQQPCDGNDGFGGDHLSSCQTVNVVHYIVFAFTHGSGFAAHLLFLLLHFGPFAIVQALTRGGHAQMVVIAVQTTVAAGATVMYRLVTDEDRVQRDQK